LGGVVKRHSLTEIGFFDVPFTEEGQKDPLYEGLPGYQKVFHWHEDTFDLPAGSVRLATNSNTENQAFRFGRHAYGLQYHIELNPEMLDNWLHYPAFKQDIINTLGTEAYDSLEREQYTQYPIYRAHTLIMFENFLQISKLL
jgi:GMP synthase-like glutamine amidotransferase